MIACAGYNELVPRMPELPEVETVVRYLAPQLEGRVIERAHLPATYKRALHNCTLRRLNAAIASQEIQRVFRRAKYIVLAFSSGYVCIHLRMTGRVLVTEPESQDKKYVTAWFSCTDGSAFYFKDVRKFGRIHFYEDFTDFDASLGVEPLSREFSAKCCFALLQRSGRAIKPFLLDQSRIVGIGNIYADEILWETAIHPLQPCNSLSFDQASQVCKATKKILKKSIEKNGTTFQSFYYGEEASGEFRELLKVFGKTDAPCPRCSSPITKFRVAQRGTHICPSCQQLG